MRRFVLCLIVLCAAAVSAAAQDITVVTFPNYYPYNFEKDGKVTGMSSEVVNAVLERAGIAAKVKVYPFVRAYKTAAHEENVLIYSIARIEERERLFKWIGPIAPLDDYFLFRLKKRGDLVIRSLEDAKKYKIGVTRNSIEQQFLERQGFEVGKNLEVVTETTQNYRKVLTNRIDFCMGTPLSVSAQMEALGLPFAELEKALLLIEQKEGLYMAFGRPTPDGLVNQVREAFEEIRAEGMADRIAEKYIKMYQ